MYKDIVSGKERVAVVGLGYVGLPLALEFAKKVDVIGVDVNEGHVAKLWQGVDPNGELGADSFTGRKISFTTNPAELKGAKFIIIAVPTPVDKYNKPDLKPLLSATKSVGKYLKKGDYVVYESTVYPGCTEEECVPLLEHTSGLKCGADFKVGYSPERINPGDLEHSLQNTVKIVSGCDEESLEQIALVYELVVSAGVHRAPAMKVAEAAKIIENTQRDVNIALMNELSILFNRMNINTYDVLSAAGTKWNFMKFSPGLVGGHCIGVDPYYLVHKAAELKYHTQMVASGRFVNDSMGGYIAKQTVKRLLAGDKAGSYKDNARGSESNNKNGKSTVNNSPLTGINSAINSGNKKGTTLENMRVLVMGVTYKENVSDIRNSKVSDIVNELVSYNIDVDIIDPKADAHEVLEEYNIRIQKEPIGLYHAVIVAVSHKEYVGLSADDFNKLLLPGGLLVDVRGIYRSLSKEFRYWSL
ncbi:MAG TPA: nucleotide sugar dehydrogenase [Rikenellaceae bacterium]|nr:nucleotide sugar dehydrogenase [Rikenellaceae bacterium]